MEIIRDKKGKLWISCADGKTEPSYKIDQNIEDQIQYDMDLQHFNDDIIQQFIIHLPFYTFPMWLKHEDQIKSPIDFCFCICLKCGKLVSGAGSLCLSFYVIQHPNDTCEFLWRPRLSCCDDILYDKTYAGIMTTVEKRLKHIFDDATKNFNDNLIISKTKCYVCEDSMPCNDKICKYVLNKISFTTTPFEHMFNLTTYFLEMKLDILSALIQNSCCRYECGNQMANVVCKNCKHTTYCSKKCKILDFEAHSKSGCENFLTIWNW